MAKWTSTAGPIQTNKVNKALGDLRMAAKLTRRVGGVHDGTTAEEAYAAAQEFDRLRGVSAKMYNIFGAVDNPVAVRLNDEIGERYGWQVTRENYTKIIADIRAAIPQIEAAAPLTDERRTPEKEAETRQFLDNMNREQAEKDAARKAAWDAILAKKPSWAEAAIVAEYHVDTSDLMSDYHANKTERIVVIGWRSGSREDFKQLQAAAVRFPEIGKELEERRENYSMGHGNYLSDHGWDGSGTGWVVESRTLGPNSLNWGPVPEDGLPIKEWPGGNQGSVPNFNPQNVQEVLDRNRVNNGFTVQPSSLGKAGFIEVVFPEKPDQEVIDELKAAGFRWALRNRCWYGLETRLPERYKVIDAFDRLAVTSNMQERPT